ncbi:type IV pilus assembly protein PilV [Candidatus Magnetomoraceae bacterium gMMP-15]
MKFKIQSTKIDKNNKGFTLIEILIAITIFAIGILGVGTMQSYSIHGNSAAKDITEANTLAEHRIERLMSLKYTDVIGGSDTEDHKFNIVWNVTQNDIINDTKTVEVIVTWQSKGNTNKISMYQVIPVM